MKGVESPERLLDEASLFLHRVVGDLPSGLPHLTLPNLDPVILRELVPGALAIVLVGYAEALGGAKAAALQGGGPIDPNQELIAHGPANILSGLFGGFLVVGSLSKTSVAIAAGARTQVANIVDRKSTRLNSSHSGESRMPSSA